MWISTENFPQMETIAQQYLTKLRIITKIPENGRLNLTNNDLNIYVSGFWSWVYRKSQGDGKLNTVNYLSSFYREINTFTTELMNSINVEKNEIVKTQKIIWLSSIAEKIKESTVGINNLIKTYRLYHKIISTLESIRQDIIDTQLKNILLFIPDKYKTTALLEMETDKRKQSNPVNILQNSPTSTHSAGSHTSSFSTPKSFPQK
jgi:hypothetical protein